LLQLLSIYSAAAGKCLYLNEPSKLKLKISNFSFSQTLEKNNELPNNRFKNHCRAIEIPFLDINSKVFQAIENLV